MEQLKILVYGAGSVGFYFGGKLMNAGHQVTFVDRADRVAALENKEIHVRSNFDQDFSFTPNLTSEVGFLDPQDLILVAVKAFHTYEIAINLLPILQPNSIIISLQNGLENEQILADILGQNLVMGTVPVFNGYFADDITLVQNAPAKILFGELDHQPSEREERLSDILSHAEISNGISRNITEEIWKNFLWHNAYNAVGTLTQTTMGQIARCDAVQETLHQLMSEAQQVAQAEGVEISNETLEELKHRLPTQANYKASMLRDLERGQKPELDSLVGALLKMAQKHGIATPVNDTIYNLIQLSMANYSLED